MGNAVTAPAHLSVEEFTAARERFRNRLVDQLGVKSENVRLVCDNSFFLCEVPPEDGVDRLLVSFGSSWQFGNEMCFRFSSRTVDDLDQANELSNVQGMFIMMQKEAEFRYFESAQIMGFNFRNVHQQGNVNRARSSSTGSSNWDEFEFFQRKILKERLAVCCCRNPSCVGSNQILKTNSQRTGLCVTATCFRDTFCNVCLSLLLNTIFLRL